MSEFPDRETLIQPGVFSFVFLLIQKIAAVLNLSLRCTLLYLTDPMLSIYYYSPTAWGGILHNK